MVVDNRALAGIHLLAVGLRHSHRRGFGLASLLQRLHVRLRDPHCGFGVIAVLRGNLALVEKLLHAPQIILIALKLRARRLQLRVPT